MVALHVFRSLAASTSTRAASSSFQSAAARSFSTGSVGASNLRARHIVKSDFSPVVFTAVTTVATVSAILFRGIVKRKVKKQMARASMTV